MPATAKKMLGRFVRPIVEQGITPALPDPLKKRIRLTNALSLFGTFVLLASIPFDWSHAPRWMLGEDIVGAVAYLSFPLLNRAGRLLASRLACLAASNLIVLGNAILLGPESGAQGYPLRGFGIRLVVRLHNEQQVGRGRVHDVRFREYLQGVGPADGRRRQFGRFQCATS